MQCSSVIQLCTTLCNPTDYSPPVLPVHQQFPEFTQTHVHWVSEAIQPSHPLSYPSSPAFNLSQHQGLFKWAHSLHQVAKVFSFFFNITASNEHSGLISLGWTSWISLQSKGPRSFLQHPTPQFKSVNSLALSFIYSPTLTSIHDYWKNHSLE